VLLSSGNGHYAIPGAGAGHLAAGLMPRPQRQAYRRADC
jgi:hypothetical protein